jgi:tRNA(Phe) wybutosine-synthesizing methylase Tyw3
VQTKVGESKAEVDLKILEQKYLELEASHQQKQKHFITQTKKLIKEREDAVEALNDVQDKCKDKLEKYDEIMAEVNLRLLEQEKEIVELTEERKNLKEIVFDLMFEKQRAIDEPAEYRVEISPQLQSEFEQKHDPKVPNVNQKLHTLLKFANEQIRERTVQINALKAKLGEAPAAEAPTQE